MKKTILMTLAALGLAGAAQADSITADSDFYTSNGNGWLLFGPARVMIT